jgi:hypothetical protein
MDAMKAGVFTAESNGAFAQVELAKEWREFSVSFSASREKIAKATARCMTLST